MMNRLILVFFAFAIYSNTFCATASESAHNLYELLTFDVGTAWSMRPLVGSDADQAFGLEKSGDGKFVKILPNPEKVGAIEKTKKELNKVSSSLKEHRSFSNDLFKHFREGEDNIIFGCFENQTLVGLFQVFGFSSPGDYLTMMTKVSPKHRGKGIASKGKKALFSNFEKQSFIGATNTNGIYRGFYAKIDIKNKASLRYNVCKVGFDVAKICASWVYVFYPSADLDFLNRESYDFNVAYKDGGKFEQVDTNGLKKSIAIYTNRSAESFQQAYSKERLFLTGLKTHMKFFSATGPMYIDFYLSTFENYSENAKKLIDRKFIERLKRKQNTLVPSCPEIVTRLEKIRILLEKAGHIDK